MLSTYAVEGISFSVTELAETLKASDLPRNHHVQRAIRRSFLRASIYQLYQFEKRLSAGGQGPLAEDVVQSYSARKHLQWKALKASWVRTPLPDGITHMKTIETALDEIARPDAVDGLQRRLQQNLVDTAIEEIVGHTNWDVAPVQLRDQLHCIEDGWYATFAAHIAHALKTDSNFRHIQQALTQRSMQHMQEAMRGFQHKAHREISGKLDTILSVEGSEGLEDRLMNSEAGQTETLLRAIQDAPFGQKYRATETKELVALRVRDLTKFFAGRDRDFGDIDSFVSARMAGRNKGLMVITAPAGFGKSALAAAWCSYARSRPEINVAVHFCNASQSGPSTTIPGKVLDHILAQVSAIYGETPDHSDPRDALVAMLQGPPPENRQLVIWLDGIDEAQGEIRAFMPPAEKLAERICVIVSARAEPGVTPKHLEPWLYGDLAHTYDQIPIKTLEKLPLDDIEELIEGMFDRKGLQVPPGLPNAIFHASDEGYAIFVRHMVEDSVENVAAGKTVELGEAPLSLANYADSELRRLYDADDWEDFEASFQLLTVLRGAIEQRLVQSCAGQANRFNPRAVPSEIMRWLAVSPPHVKPPLVGFAHPKLAEVFRRAIESEEDGRIDSTLDRMIRSLNTDCSRMNEYALLHLPYHMVEAGQKDAAAELLMNLEFIEARFSRLGPEIAPDAMAVDWREFFRSGGL